LQEGVKTLLLGIVLQGTKITWIKKQSCRWRTHNYCSKLLVARRASFQRRRKLSRRGEQELGRRIKPKSHRRENLLPETKKTKARKIPSKILNVESNSPVHERPVRRTLSGDKRRQVGRGESRGTEHYSFVSKITAGAIKGIREKQQNG